MLRQRFPSLAGANFLDAPEPALFPAAWVCSDRLCSAERPTAPQCDDDTGCALPPGVYSLQRTSYRPVWWESLDGRRDPFITVLQPTTARWADFSYANLTDAALGVKVYLREPHPGHLWAVFIRAVRLDRRESHPGKFGRHLLQRCHPGWCDLGSDQVWRPVLHRPALLRQSGGPGEVPGIATLVREI